MKDVKEPRDARDLPPDRDFRSLEALMRACRAAGGMLISFEDCTGVTRQVPGLKIPINLQWHMSPLCSLSKACPEGFRKCIEGKRRAVERAHTRKGPYWGLCHLGLADIVCPVISDGKHLGTVFYGSAPLSGPEGVPLDEIRRRCEALGMPAADVGRALGGMTPAPLDRVLAGLVYARLVAEFIRVSFEAWAAANPAATASLKGGPAAAGAWPVVRAQQFIRAHYRHELGLEMVAGEVGLSPAYFSRLFSRVARESFVQYVTRIRVDAARRLLDRSELSITEIAFQCGFNDSNYFSRAFSRAAGASPRAWRANARRK